MKKLSEIKEDADEESDEEANLGRVLDSARVPMTSNKKEGLNEIELEEKQKESSYESSMTSSI